MYIPVARGPQCIALAVVVVLALVLLLMPISATRDRPFMDSAAAYWRSSNRASSIELNSIFHYATSKNIPQQTVNQIGVTFDVLVNQPSCNFLVFGLGHDSIMWASFNANGNTIFLEENPAWVEAVLKYAPFLRAHTVEYPTKMSQADTLLQHYQSEPACLPPNVQLEGNTRCKLALSNLSADIYDKEWDVIMVDAPRGYAGNLPGRMSAIYTAAVMARNRKGRGVTHVMVHDVDRRVERVYAEEFLCKKNLKHAVGKLWHFEIPPNPNWAAGDGFC